MQPVVKQKLFGLADLIKTIPHREGGYSTFVHTGLMDGFPAVVVAFRRTHPHDKRTFQVAARLCGPLTLARGIADQHIVPPQIVSRRDPYNAIREGIDWLLGQEDGR